MHDCRKTKEQITELVLDGTDDRADEVLSAELRACRDCRAEFEALSATLRITTRLKETAVPAESYWPGYHARLRQKLTNANVSSAHTSRRDSWLIQFFRSSVPVPLPVATALIIACSILVPIAIRTARRPITQAPTIVQVPVEVPVIQEKVVTRVVYRERRSPPGNSQQVINNAANIGGPFARSQKPRTEDMPASLIGFKPTEEVKLTVIKGGSANEK